MGFAAFVSPKGLAGLRSKMLNSLMTSGTSNVRLRFWLPAGFAIPASYFRLHDDLK